MKDIKYFVFDLDKTLLNSSHSISEYTKSILLKLIDKDYKIIFATGRPEIVTQDLNCLFPFDYSLITSNGAIMKLEDGNLYKSNLISREKSDMLYDFLKEESCDSLVYTDKHIYYILKHKNNKAFDAESKIMNNEVKESVTVLDSYHDISKEELILKVIIVEEDKNKYDYIFNKVNDIDDLYSLGTLPNMFDILLENVSKGNMLTDYLKSIGGNVDQMITFGDNQNDVSMHEIAGISVCPENGIEEVKKIVDFVCDSNDNDGVAKFIEEKFL